MKKIILVITIILLLTGCNERTLPKEERKLNLVKVFGAIGLVVLVIVTIYFAFFNSNVEKIDENVAVANNNINNTRNISEQEVAIESTKTIEEILASFGGEVKEQVKSDTYYVSKDGTDYTVYLDGEITTGKIVPWNGEETKPKIEQEKNINIYNASELAWVANQVISGEKNFNGVTITLKNNIDLGARKKDDGTWEGTNWNSIVGFLDEIENKANTDKTSEEITSEDENVINENLKRFAGTFDGNGFSIRGMNIENNKSYQGLFGYQSGTISNLTVKFSNVRGGNAVGALVGLNEGKILNCKVESTTVSGIDKIGGIVGVALTNSFVDGCETVNESEICGADYVGGIVGYANNNVTINNSTNRANVRGSKYVGGIAGITFYGTILNNTSCIDVNILGNEYIGGLVGYSDAQIEKSYNTANIKGTKYVGGIVGTNYQTGNINSSYNKGKIEILEDCAGGIAGTNNGSISSCYNIAPIDSSAAEGLKIGGICGQNSSDSFINTSYNIGKIKLKEYAGGIVGADFGTISNCFYEDTCLEKNDENDYIKTEVDMKSNILTNLGENFKQDTENINSGYPILNWQ